MTSSGTGSAVPTTPDWPPPFVCSSVVGLPGAAAPEATPPGVVAVAVNVTGVTPEAEAVTRVTPAGRTSCPAANCRA